MTSPRYNLRLLLTMVTTCCVAFGIFARQPSDHVCMAAGAVPAFWMGVAGTIVGATLERWGDHWLTLAVVTSVLGSVLAVLSLFTCVYYMAFALLT